MAGAVPLCLAPGFSNSGGTIGFWHADTDKAMCSDQVPWCAVSSAGLQLDAGPAPVLFDPTGEDPSSTISMAINLLSCSSSIMTHSTVRSHSSMRKPSSNLAAGHKHGLEQHTHASTLAISSSSIMHSLEDLPVVSADSAVLSPARKPGASSTAAVPIPAQAAAPAGRMSSAAWSPVVSNPMMLPLKRLKLSIAAAASSDSTSEPPASPAPSAVMKATFVCPPAPKRPPPAVVLVPLSELGGVAAA